MSFSAPWSQRSRGPENKSASKVHLPQQDPQINLVPPAEKKLNRLQRLLKHKQTDEIAPSPVAVTHAHHGSMSTRQLAAEAQSFEEDFPNVSVPDIAHIDLNKSLPTPKESSTESGLSRVPVPRRINSGPVENYPTTTRPTGNVQRQVTQPALITEQGSWPDNSTLPPTVPPNPPRHGTLAFEQSGSDPLEYADDNSSIQESNHGDLSQAWVFEAKRFESEGSMTFEDILWNDFRDQFPRIANPTHDSTQQKVAGYMITRAQLLLTNMIDGLKKTYEEDFEQKKAMYRKSLKKFKDSMQQDSITDRDGPTASRDSIGGTFDLTDQPHGASFARSNYDLDISVKDDQIEDLKHKLSLAQAQLQSYALGAQGNLEAQVDAVSEAQWKQTVENLQKGHEEQLSDQSRKHNDFVDRLQISNQRMIDQAKSARQEEFSKLEKDNRSLADSVKTAKLQADAVHQVSMEKMKQDLQKLYDQNTQQSRRQHELELSEKKRAYDSELSSLKHQMRLEFTKSQNEQTTLTRDHDTLVTHLNELLNSASQQQEQMRRAHARDLDQANREYEKLNSISEQNLQEFKRRLQGAKEANEREKLEITAQRQEELARSSREHQAELTRLNVDYTQRVNTLIAEHKAAQELAATTMSSLEAQHQQELQKLRDERDASEKEFKDKQTHLQTSSAQALQELEYGHSKLTADLKQAHKKEKENIVAKCKTDWEHLQDEVRELREGLLARDVKMYEGTIFHPKDIPQKSDDRLKADFLVVQRMVEEIGGLWKAWRQHPTLWTEQVMSKIVEQHGERIAKKAVLQDIVWKQLFQFIFRSPYRMFGAKGVALDKEWAQECGETSPDDPYYTWPRPGLKAERWRYMTMCGCRDILTTIPSEEDPRTQLKKGFSENTTNLARKLEDELSAVIDLTQENQNLIGRLSRRAAKMWIDFEGHRCRIVIQLTGLATKSTSETVARVRKGVILTILPSLGRWGNSDGEGLDTFTIIAGCAGESLRIA